MKKVVKDNKEIKTQDNTTSPAEIKLRYFEVVLDFIKSIAWPLIAIIIFISLSAPVNELLNSLPDKMSKVSIGDIFSIEIQQVAKDKGLTELGNTIGTLSPEAITVLLRLGNNPNRLMGSSDNPNEYYLPSDERMKSIYELESKKLLTFTVPIKEYLKSIDGLGLKKSDIFPESIIYVMTRSLSADEIKYVESERYQLTKAGENAYELIISVVSQSLAK